MEEVLFAGTLPVHREREVAENTCELVRRMEGFELRLCNQKTFTIFLSKISEPEYYAIKETQSIRVDYSRFIATLAELLKRVQKKELFMEIEESIKIIEGNSFRNILHLELPLKNLTETEYRTYISEILCRQSRKTAALERENSILREELSAARRASSELAEKHREERAFLEKHKTEARMQAEESEERMEALKKENEKLAAENSRQKKQSKAMEDDLRKANEIIKKNFEDLKTKIKAEAALKQEMGSFAHEKEELEAANHQLEMEVLEKNEEIKILKDLEKERIEAINSLKALNKSLNRKLESTYRIYNRIYRKAEDTEEDTRTEETNSSLIAPESVHY